MGQPDVDQVRAEKVSLARRACLLAWLIPAAALAHNPDTSYARCIIADDRVEVRLTCDVFTLQMITAIDADHDQRVTRDELRGAAPAIERFLREHVHLEIEAQDADLGVAAAPLWPGETGEGLGVADWHTAAGLITFPFRHSRPKPAREVALSFDLFQALTSRHTVLGAFEHGDKKEEVTFTEAEPDYLFDATYVAASTPGPSPPPLLTPSSSPAPPAAPRATALSLTWLLVFALVPLLWWLQRCSGKSRS